MKPILVAAFVLSVVAALIGSQARSQVVCYDRAVLMAYLSQEHGLALYSWGLTDAGNMQELFLSPTGHWAVVETTPAHCSAVVSFPHKERGRLSDPPHNDADIRPRMTPGAPS